MNIFLEAHRIVLQQLLEKKVDFILIGGYAVNYYGYNRATADMDVWINPDNNNKLLLLDALASLDFDAEGLAIIRSWNFEKPQKFHVFQKPFQTEFMTHISGIKYPDAKKIAVKTEIDGLILVMIHINSLIQNKKSTGRTKDLADVEYLEKIMALKNKIGDG
jgi:predicted nucleotidyltransferase